MSTVDESIDHISNWLHLKHRVDVTKPIKEEDVSRACKFLSVLLNMSDKERDEAGPVMYKESMAVCWRIIMLSMIRKSKVVNKRKA